jgi:hypothetical protein
MSVAPEVDEDKLRDTKYPKFRVLTGGKQPPEPPAKDWLSDYEVGTAFVCRHNNSKEVDYNHYYVMFKSLPEVVLLKWILPDDKVLDYYVDPKRFSSQFKDPVILGVHKREETDEQCDPRGQSDMVLHEAVQRSDQLPPTEGSEETNLQDRD